MAEPSKKSPKLEEFLTKVFLFDRRAAIRLDRCVPKPIGCGGEASHFRDEISRREYTISGLCQKCQDFVFGHASQDDES